jgi:hypothetical protein
MIAITRAILRKWMEALLHIHDTPQRTAAAFAVGVFFGFSPFLGLHTLLALGVAFIFNLNRVAVLVGVYSNLPWIIGAWYAGMTAFGAWLMGAPVPKGLGTMLRQVFALSLFTVAFWREVAHKMRPLFWPYFVGSLIGAVVLSIVAFYLTRGFIERYKHLQEVRHKAKH